MPQSPHFLISMAEMPSVHGYYLYSLDEEEVAWTQEAHYLMIVTEYAGVMTIGARTQAFQSWAAFMIPPGYRCTMRRSTEGMTSAFWGRFTPNGTGAPTLALPSYTQLGEFGPFWFLRLRAGLNRSFQMRGEMKCMMTDLIWHVGVDPGQIRLNPALLEAEKLIEDSLHKKLRVEEIAQHLGISHNQLIRLFQDEHGVPPLEFIRHRRQNLACRLLLETDLQVKQIAAAVGISDLAQFNRLVKGASGGLSPRELRSTTRPANLFRA